MIKFIYKEPGMPTLLFMRSKGAIVSNPNRQRSWDVYRDEDGKIWTFKLRIITGFTSQQKQIYDHACIHLKYKGEKDVSTSKNTRKKRLQAV